MSAAELFEHAGNSAGHAPPPPAPARRRWPSSLAYLGRVVRRPWSARPGRLIAAALPEGARDDHPLEPQIARLHGGRWPTHPLWITAVQLDSGAPVIFGRPGAPVVDVGTAVRCSTAVPGIRRPIRIGDVRYVDGGIASATHAAAIASGEHRRPGLVIVSSPLSCFAALRFLLRVELRALARRGIKVLLLEPDRELTAAMGWNPLDARRAPPLAAHAFRSAGASLLAQLGK
jgi:NTE family protein